jgi:PPOX class probable F420-dependent enzyme
MRTLEEAGALGAEEQGLAVISTLRADGSIHTSVVNAGVMPHPFTGEPVIAFVTYGKVKLGNLRNRPQLTVTFRSGWRWAAVEGTAELIGPDDPHAEVDAERLRMMLRDIFVAAGGSHDNWDEYDQLMSEQRREAVLVVPTRIYGR